MSIGCKASVNAEAKASADHASLDADGEAAFAGDSGTEAADGLDKPLAQTSAGKDGAALAVISGPALLGARRDLNYSGPTTANCSCLAVHLGQPQDPAFKWDKGAPEVDSSRQLVVALTSNGVACEKEVGLGASYKGYVVSGQDVIIMVERASEGIPVTSGAIIPRPMGGGRVYSVAAEKGNPFGGAVENPDERCLLELPQAMAVATSETSALVGSDEAPNNSDEAEQAEPSEFVDVVDEHQLGEDAPPSAPKTRDGFFLGLQPTVGYLLLRQRGVDAEYQGVGFGLDMLIGGSPTEGLAVGAILGGATFPTPDFKAQGATLPSDVDLNLFHIGGFVDYYFEPDSGLHLLGELAYARLGTSGTRDSAQDFQGFALSAGIGYDWWLSDNWSLGFLGRCMLAAMQHQQSGSDHWLLLPALNFTATYH